MTYSREEKRYAYRYFAQMERQGLVPVVWRFGNKTAWELRKKADCVELLGQKVWLRGIWLSKWGVRESGVPAWVEGKYESKKEKD